MSKSVAKQISGEVGDVYDDVIHSLKKMAKHLGEDTSDALSTTAASLSHAAVSLAEEAKAQSKAIAKRAGQEVREHPAATAAIAAAAVALIGLAIARRRAADDA